MAVVHHAFRWRPTAVDCAEARSIADHARAGDVAALARIGHEALAAACDRPDRLAAFDLAAPDFVRARLTPAAVEPGLVTLLAWLPRLEPLADAAAIAALYREGGSPVAPRTDAGRSFHPLSAWLGTMAAPGLDTGGWARVATLARRLRAAGRGVDADRVGRLADGDPALAWLVATIIW